MTVKNVLLDKADWYFDDALANYLFSNELKKQELAENDYRKIYRWAANHIGFFVTWLLLLLAYW